MYRILQFVSNKFANSMYSETANVKDKKHIPSACVWHMRRPHPLI